MAFRTDAERVRKLIDDDLDDEDFDPHIEAASLLVDELLVDSPTFTYTAARREMVERYLAAHFYTVRVGQVTEEQAGPVREKVAFKIDLYLANTKYGQQAIILDTGGNLARWQAVVAAGGPRATTLTYLGTQK